MEPSESSSSGGNSSQSQTQTRTGGLKGPRPTLLKVSKDSHKIKKPPVAPPAPLPPQRSHSQHQQTLIPAVENRQPVVIFSVSPKVIHSTVSGFMELVQRLTGSSSSSADPTSIAPTTTGGDISPAARLASIEKASPSGRKKDRETAAAADVLEITERVEVCQIPGILSPEPANLPLISPGIFSPASDPGNFFPLHDLSPFMHGNMFIPSPSTLFTTPSSVYPSPSSSFEPLNPFFDF